MKAALLVLAVDDDFVHDWVLPGGMLLLLLDTLDSSSCSPLRMSHSDRLHCSWIHNINTCSDYLYCIHVAHITCSCITTFVRICIEKSHAHVKHRSETISRLQVQTGKNRTAKYSKIYVILIISHHSVMVLSYFSFKSLMCVAFNSTIINS